MKKIITIEDVVGGAFIIRNSYPKGCDNYSFAATVAYQICWRDTEAGQKWFLSSVMTDGMACCERGSREELFAALNNDQFGYRRLKPKKFVKLFRKTPKYRRSLK